VKAYVYRLYPSKPQERLLAQTVETCRRLYNACVAERKEAWGAEQRTVTKFAQLRHVKTVKATDPYAKDVHRHPLC
jgi:putative transposase